MVKIYIKKINFDNVFKKLSDRIALVLYFSSLIFNVVSHAMVNTGGGFLNILFSYALWVYFQFVYGKNVDKTNIAYFIPFVLAYSFLMQFFWDSGAVHETLGVIFRETVWALVSLFPVVGSAMAISKKTKPSYERFLRLTVFLFLFITSVASIVILTTDPDASKLTATGRGEAYIPFLLEYGMVYAVALLFPYIFEWIRSSFAGKKIIRALIGLAMLATMLVALFMASFLIAMMATVFGLLTYFVLSIRDSRLRYLVLFIIIVALLVIVISDFHVTILKELVEVIDSEIITYRLNQVILFFTDGVIEGAMVRLDMYLTSIDNFFLHPLSGNIIWDEFHVLSGHSTILDILDGCGIFVFGFFMIFLLKALSNNLAGRPRKQRGAVLGSFAAFLVISTFNPIFSAPQILAFYILGANIFLFQKSEDSDQSALSKGKR